MIPPVSSPVFPSGCTRATAAPLLAAASTSPGDPAEPREPSDEVEASHPSAAFPPLRVPAEDPEVAASQALIESLVGHVNTLEGRRLVEGALSEFSLDNLRLLESAHVKIDLRRLDQMPETFLGKPIRKTFLDDHDRLVRACRDELARRWDPLPGEDPEAFVMRTVQYEGGLRLASSDFGVFLDLAAEHPEELTQASYQKGYCVADSSRAGVFVLDHHPTKGTVIHEIAHALDALKSFGPMGRFLGRCIGLKTPEWASQGDRALGHHYEEAWSPTGQHPSWSNYAFESHKVQEFLAEAVRVSCENPEAIRQADPALFSFARAFVTQDRYPALQSPSERPGVED